MSDALEHLVEPAVRERFSESAWTQGAAYLAREAVVDRTWRRNGNTSLIEADVRRSATRAYHVTIACDAHGVCNWECTCPFGNAACEHSAAVVQAWLTQAATFEGQNGEALPARVAAQPAQPPEPVAPALKPPGPPAVRREGPSPRPLLDGKTLLQVREGLLVDVNVQLASPALLELLNSLGDLHNRSAGSLTYRLTPQGLQRALGTSNSLDHLLAALADAGLPEVPPAIAAQWQNWIAATGNFHLYDELSVIEFADDYTLQELLRGSGLRRYLLHIFSPRLVAVYPGRIDALVADLEQRGYMPRIE